jgi:type I phosphodiesterase/nucleotide pyrophosphatase
LLRHLVAAGLALVAIAAAIGLGYRARMWNEELAVVSPLAGAPPVPVTVIGEPGTPRLARRVVLVVIDGLGAGESQLAFLDELRRRGAAAVARVPYPTVSRPNYVTILTGVPPRDSGVRANRVIAPVAVDTVMDRVRAAGLRVATASDHGSLASLFLRHTDAITGVDFVEHGARVAPAPPIAWPFDDARRTESLDALGPEIAELAASDASLVAVLVLDVDRAGHADGVGPAYRAAAAAVDRMLRRALAAVDLSRDAVIVTADHGHVTPGGHGGREAEVSHVPLVLVGAGIAPGAVALDPRLIDVAPTLAALLGVAAPGHAEGRALVELLQLSPADAARRRAADGERLRRVAGIVDAADAGHASPEPAHLVFAVAAIALAAALARVLGRRGAVAVRPGALAGVVGFAAMLVATAVVTRGRWSPSYVPSLARVIPLGAVAVVVSIALQITATARAIGAAHRRGGDRLAAVNGAALVGLAVALATVAAVRAWFCPPFVDVPGPLWMVGVPAIELAAATGAAAIAIGLGISSLRDRRSRTNGRPDG